MNGAAGLRINPLATIAIGFLAALLVQVAPVQAATTVSGLEDANTPLVIDPDLDPLTRDLNVYGPTAVGQIRRMPVTKRISKVTIGDLARPDTCAADTDFELHISSNGEA